MKLLIKDIPLNERPRERLFRVGVENLSNEELLSIILKTGTKDESVKMLSLELLKKIESIDRLKDININTLTSINGIGKTKASFILASIELGRRIYLNKNNSSTIKLTNPKSIYLYMKGLLFDKKQEYFYCLYFDSKQQLIDKKLLFIGTINKSIVHPREIFKYAYLLSSSSIVCIHNHPSGDISPSKEDIIFTKALIDIGKVQDIPILDHVIVGSDNYYSMADNLELFLWKGTILKY